MADTLILRLRGDFIPTGPKPGCAICRGERIAGAAVALDAATKHMDVRGWPAWWVRIEDEPAGEKGDF